MKDFLATNFWLSTIIGVIVTFNTQFTQAIGAAESNFCQIPNEILLTVDRLAQQAETVTNPATFSFKWNENQDEFMVKASVEFPKNTSLDELFSIYFLNETATKNITHSKSCVRTLSQKVNGNEKLTQPIVVNKALSLEVTGEKCAFCGSFAEKCIQNTFSSSCTFTDHQSNLLVLNCTGNPNSALKSSSRVISCAGRPNEKKVCSFEVKGKPMEKNFRSCRTLALGGAAEALYNIFGVAFLAESGSFSENNFEKTSASKEIDDFYDVMMDDRAKLTYP